VVTSKRKSKECGGGKVSCEKTLASPRVSLCKSDHGGSERSTLKTTSISAVAAGRSLPGGYALDDHELPDLHDEQEHGDSLRSTEGRQNDADSHNRHLGHHENKKLSRHSYAQNLKADVKEKSNSTTAGKRGSNVSLSLADKDNLDCIVEEPIIKSGNHSTPLLGSSSPLFSSKGSLHHSSPGREATSENSTLCIRRRSSLLGEGDRTPLMSLTVNSSCLPTPSSNKHEARLVQAFFFFYFFLTFFLFLSKSIYYDSDVHKR
jgi:hypothetical protein